MSNKLESAFKAFDEYNSRDPHTESGEDGKPVPRELLYGLRMTRKLDTYAPSAPEHLRLAARCQHIGRWEIPRSNYPMDRKGYLQWRSAEKMHHAAIAENILNSIGYDAEVVNRVKSLLLKKELTTNPDTQVLEDVVCLVFIEHYLEEFAARHDDVKVIEILKKTMKKMSPRSLEAAVTLNVSGRVNKLLTQATSV